MPVPAGPLATMIGVKPLYRHVRGSRPDTFDSHREATPLPQRIALEKLTRQPNPPNHGAGNRIDQQHPIRPASA